MNNQVKNYTAWQLFKAKLFGKRHYELSLPWELEAYSYKGVWYITKYRQIYG